MILKRYDFEIDMIFKRYNFKRYDLKRYDFDE